MVFIFNLIAFFAHIFFDSKLFHHCVLNFIFATNAAKCPTFAGNFQKIVFIQLFMYLLNFHQTKNNRRKKMDLLVCIFFYFVVMLICCQIKVKIQGWN